MTKEELKQEVEGYVKKILEGTEFEDDDIDVCAYTKREMLEAILHFAEPREKQIQIDAEQIRALQKDKGELTDRVRELEAQIEKMKCCENCQHWEGREPIPSLAEEGYYCFNDYPFECKRWELAEELKEIKEND